jgi:hypothetical protein
VGQIALLGNPRDSECAWIENISDRGARVISRRPWRFGERMLISSKCPPFCSTAARVVYCQTLLDGLYAIGCESTNGGALQLLGQNPDSKFRDTGVSGKPVPGQDFSDTMPAES